MRIVHMDSGLGNQMLDYAEYLAIKEANPVYPVPQIWGEKDFREVLKNIKGES